MAARIRVRVLNRLVGITMVDARLILRSENGPFSSLRMGWRGGISGSVEPLETGEDLPLAETLLLARGLLYGIVVR